jgi:hypothetical protein
MFNQNWEVFVDEKFGLLIVDIFIMTRNLGKRSVAHFGKDGSIQLTELKEGFYPVKPTFSLPLDLWNIFKESANKHVGTLDKKEVDAELKATKYHLQDMRRLVFKTELNNSKSEEKTNDKANDGSDVK